MGFLQFHTRQDIANLLDGMTDAAKQAVGVKPKYAELKITLNFGNRVVVLPRTAEHVLSLLPLRSSHVRCSSPMTLLQAVSLSMLARLHEYLMSTQTSP